MDKRAEKLAELVVNYSTNIGNNDRLIVLVEKEFLTYANFIEFKAKQKGAEVKIEYYDLDRERKIKESGDLKKEAEEKMKLANWCTAMIRIDATENPLFLEGVDPKRLAEYQAKVSMPFLETITTKKWNITSFPCKAHAKLADMSLKEYSNFLYKATLIDWEGTTEEMKKIKGIFDEAEEVHLYVPGQTDISLCLKDRGGKISNGFYNMPDGEVYFGPQEDSTEGIIHFPYEAIWNGNNIKGITLEFENGEVVKATAETNQEILEAQLERKGVKKLGEFGIGCNYSIDKYITNMTFDEKIGGTIHLALGDSLPYGLNDGGGLNIAETHWDHVCDLRENGQIWVNGKLVQQNGQWKFPTRTYSIPKTESRIQLMN